jgi:NADH-quinone oxidoreductase subunit C
LNAPGPESEPSAVQAGLDALAAGFATLFGADVHASVDASGTPCIDVDRTRWLTAATHAHDRIGMTFFDWLSAVDAPEADPPGVQIVAHVASPLPNPARAVRRLLLRTTVPDGVPMLSLTAIWPGAAWHERETFEMFGVEFAGFDDGTGLGLRPLLLPDGFEGTPLRKSFVLAARAAKAWPGAKEPGESDSSTSGRSPGRRKGAPPGVPDPATWGPREVTGEHVSSAGEEES